MTAQMEEQLICPGCSAPLLEQGANLHCLRCQKSWPVVNGIPHFVQDFPYWGEIPLEQMQEVNLAAETGPWKAALLDCYDPRVQRAAGMMLNLERANWH